MTVDELINELDQMPADAEVILEGDHDTGVVGNLENVRLNEDGSTVTLSV